MIKEEEGLELAGRSGNINSVSKSGTVAMYEGAGGGPTFNGHPMSHKSH